MPVEVPARMFHNACGGIVIAERRQIIAEPADISWPRDSFVLVPYCMECRTIVSFINVSVSRIPVSAMTTTTGSASPK